MDSFSSEQAKKNLFQGCNFDNQQVNPIECGESTKFLAGYDYGVLDFLLKQPQDWLWKRCL